MEILLSSELTHSSDEELFIAFIPALDAYLFILVFLSLWLCVRNLP